METEAESVAQNEKQITHEGKDAFSEEEKNINSANSWENFEMRMKQIVIDTDGETE